MSDKLYGFKDSKEISEIDSTKVSHVPTTPAEIPSTTVSEALANMAESIESVSNRLGGNYLPAGTNIDNLTKVHSGWWVYERANVSGTFPVSDTYGTIGYIHGTSDNIGMQFIRSNSQGADNRILYVRYKMGGAWGAWQRFVTLGTTQLTITRTSNSYVAAAGMSSCYAYKKGGFLFFRGVLTLATDMPSNTTVQIGTVSNWVAPVSIFEDVPATAYGREVLSVTLSYDGRLNIRNNCSYSLSGGGAFNFTAMIPCSDGSE